MPLTPRENYLRNASFQSPEYMPAHIHISPASWDQCRGELEEVVARHPRLWPDFVKGRVKWNDVDFGPAYTAGVPFTDAWGCVWETAVNGIEGVVTHHPLADWAAWDSWRAPNPLETADRGPVDWPALRKSFEAQRARGEYTEGGLPHGFFFMRLTYLRGFENALLDMMMEEPMFERLIETLYEHNRLLVQQYLDIGVDVISLGEDLGAQTAPLIGPDMFHKFCTPTYERLIRPCRERGCHVMLHSDGYIMDLIDELLFAGVTILNPQDLCNGLDNLREALKGRVCIRLDVDRQTTVPYGTPREIRELVEAEVRLLGSPEGGLELLAGIYPPTTPDNVHALASAFEEFQDYWFSGPRRS